MGMSQLAVGSRENSWQWAVGSWQLTITGMFTGGKRHRNKFHFSFFTFHHFTDSPLTTQYSPFTFFLFTGSLSLSKDPKTSVLKPIPAPWPALTVTESKDLKYKQPGTAPAPKGLLRSNEVA
jgi:hypothetical protein